MINFTGQKPERTGVDMNENKIKEFVGRLSDEQKKKALQCKNEEELLKFFGKEGIELPDDLLDSVSGGDGFFDYLRQTASGVTGTIKNTVATGPAIQVPHVATGAGINVKK